MRRPASINGAFEALARFTVRLRWPIVAFWLLAAVVTAVALPSLGSHVNDNNSAFLSQDAPSTKATNLGAALFGGGARSNRGELEIVASRSTGLGAADVTEVTAVTRAVRRVTGVDAVNVLAVSPDRQALILRVRARISRNDIRKDKVLVDALRATFRAATPSSGLSLHLAGDIATAVANQSDSNRAGGQVQNASFVFIILLLLIVFRSVPAAMITLLPAGLALSISGRLIGALGAGGLQISNITQVLLIVLLLGAGTDYGLFLVFRVREELREGTDPRVAVERSVVRVGESITASAGTVILALLTLLLAGFGLYHDLGVPLAVGMATVLAIGLTLQPALLAILGRRAFWPSRIRAGDVREGLWGRVAQRVVRRPGLTLAAGVVLFLALAAGALGYHGSGFGGSTTAPKGSDAAAGNAALRAHFPRTSSNPANIVMRFSTPVWQAASPLVPAEMSLGASGAFAALVGPLDPAGVRLAPADLQDLHAQLGPPQRLPVLEPAGVSIPLSLYNAYRATAQFVAPDGRTVQFQASLRAGAQDTTAALQATPHVRAVVTRAARAAGAIQWGLAGEAAAVYDIDNTASHDLAVVVPVAIVAIGLLLALVLRSAVAPLYLIVSVALSYLAALGVATIVFIDIGGQGGISFILPFLMFIFLLALGEDYNILVMTRIREEAHSLPLKEAVVRAIGRTGATVTAAGLILGGTFAVFAIVGGGGSGGAQLRAIGFGLAAGILMDTFLVRTLLVPSTVILLGRWNWWPQRLEMDQQ